MNKNNFSIYSLPLLQLRLIWITGILGLSFIEVYDHAYAQVPQDCREHVEYGTPGRNGILLCRLGYILDYSPRHKVPDWVGYRLTVERVNGAIERTDNFREDTELPVAARSQNRDYDATPLAKGHLAPAGAMAWDLQAMSESFLLSNMAPQIHNGFNNGIWKALENRVRKWTRQRGELYVVSGSIHDTDPPARVVGPNHVSVPTHFYKVIFDPVRVDAIAVILPHASRPSSELDQFIRSVDEVEDQTGLDFLSKLPPSIEQAVEATRASSLWSTTQAPPSVPGFPVLGNRRSRLYHRPDCPSYDRIGAQNRVMFPTAEAAEAEDYTVAGNCP